MSPAVRNNIHSALVPPIRLAAFAPLPRLPWLAICWSIVWSSTTPLVASADILVLESGGVLRGEWLNRFDRDPAEYLWRSPAGAELRIPSERVAKAIREKPAEREYEALAPTFPDTVQGQWDAAEWCRTHQLNGARDVHLRRVLELDDRFVPAWHGLGYVQLGGRWQRPADRNRERGYELHKGRWRLAQDIERIEDRAKERAAEDDWRKRINVWHDLLDSPAKYARACAEFAELRDPRAIPALAAIYSQDRRPAVRLIIVRSVARIEGPAADNFLFHAALSDNDSEIFHTATEQLELRRSPELVPALVRALQSTNPIAINRAAYMLGRANDRSVIPPLIDALITRHWVPLGGAHSSSSYSATFGRANSPNDTPASAGLSKSDPQWAEVWLQNQEVLDALVKLTGGANFSFQVQAWRVWYAADRQRATATIDARRNK